MDTGVLETVRQIGKNAKIRDKCVVDDCISKSPYDQTYIGVVVEKKSSSPIASDSGKFVNRWVVVAGGYTFEIEMGRSNITSVGQRVRVYIPSKMKDYVYAEVINPATTPDEAVYVEDDKQYDAYKSYGVDESKGITEENCNELIVIDSITEKWSLADATYLKRLYLLTVFNAGKEEEEVTNIICPDGKIMKLEGFFVNRWGHTDTDNADNTNEEGDDSDGS